MNGEIPSSNPRAELEARLTAFILGELPAHESSALRQAMEEDAELAALYERLKAASKLVREAATSPVEAAKEPAAPLRLSEERRQKLLAQFKTVAPKEFVRTKPKPSATTRLLEVAAVVAAMGVLAGLLLPALASSKMKAKSVAITYNLRQIDGAKLAWAEEKHKAAGAVPTMNDLTPYLGRGGGGEFPKPIAGETYNIGRVGEPPTAELKGNRRISVDGETLAAVTRTPGQVDVVSSGKKAAAIIDDDQAVDIALPPAKATPLPPPVRTTIVLPPAEILADASTTTVNGYVDTGAESNQGADRHKSEVKRENVPVILGNVPTNIALLGDGDPVNQVFKLKNADAEKIASEISALYPDGRVVAKADLQTHTLIVNGANGMMPQVGKMVRNLDVPPQNMQHVFVMDLTNGDGQDVLPVLQNLFPSSSVRESIKTPANGISFVTKSDGTQSAANQAVGTGGAGGASGGGGRFGGSFSRFNGGPAAVTNSYADSGDPDWIRFAEHPQQQLAGNNSFVSRGSYLPPGVKLDIDSIHAQNPAVSESSFKNDGLLTNQGVGAWELSVSPTETDRGAGGTSGGGATGGAGTPNSEFRFYHDLNGNGAANASTGLAAKQMQAGEIDPTTGLPVGRSPADKLGPGAIDPATGLPAMPLPADVPGFNGGVGNFTNGGNIAIARLNTDGSLETDQSNTSQSIRLTGLTQIGGNKQTLFAGGTPGMAGVDALTNPEVLTVSGTAVKTGQPIESESWRQKQHIAFGNNVTGAFPVTPADGSVQQFTVNGLRNFANHTADTTAGSDPNVLLFPGDEQEAAGEKQTSNAPDLYTLNVVGYINLNLTNPVASTGTDYSATNGVIEIARETASDEAVRRDATRKPVPTLGDLPQLGALLRSETNAVQTAETNHYFRGIGALTQRDMRESTVPSQELTEEVPAWRTNEAAKPAPEFRGSPVDAGHYTNSLGNVTVSADPESKQSFFITDADTPQSVSNVLLNIDRNGGSNQPDVLHYNQLQIEGETEYARQEKLLKQLKDLDKEKLKETLAAGSSDPIMSQILHDENAAKESLSQLKAQFGPTNPEVQRKEKEIATLDGEADDRAKGVLKGLEITTKTLKEQAQKESKGEISYAKASDISDALKSLGADGKKTEANKSYQEKKAELDVLMAERRALTIRSAGRGEAFSAAEVYGLAEADGKATQNRPFYQRLGQTLTGQVTETAKIKIEQDMTNVAGLSGQPAASGIYDPYFVQTEFEVIESEKVLDQVIDRLNLDGDWAAQKGSAAPLKRSETRALLKKSLQLVLEKNNGLVDIKVQSDNAAEAAKIANTIAEVYTDYRRQQRERNVEGGEKALNTELAELDQKIAQSKQELVQLSAESAVQQTDAPVAKPAAPAPVPQPEVSTSENAFSTFSLNIADVSFKLAAASLEKGRMPEAASIRSEEFINAFDYRDPEPAPGAPLGFAWERAQYPFAHNRDLLRFAVKTAAAGREPGRPLNIVLLLDKSGSMERADRVKIIHEALRVLATQLQPQDRLSVVTFARVARLWVDGLPGSQAGEVAEGLDKLTPEGGTNLEEAMRLAYETARRHYLAGGINRVVLLTDGAANLGNVDPESLKQSAEEHRKEGIALDCFGVGWEGYNDDLMEVLSRNGGGRYGFINTPEEAANGFAAQLAGALNVAAYDVKVQVEFNPKRVTAYRQIGYAKQQLTKEQFRDNTVKAAQVGAAESGNALYAIEVNPNGEGPVATVRVRYRVPGTEDYPEHEWVVPYDGNALPLEQASPAMRLAGTASAFSEWLAMSPFAGDVTTDRLLELMRGVPETYGADERPKKMEWMIRQAKSLEGK
jgi:secreted protein with Ig-like and vWFA domain